MVNNLELIKPLLKFPDEDTCYHLQVLMRKKENPQLGSNSYCVKTYYVSSLDYLDKKMPEIIALCTLHNARACINLNRRSYEKLAYQLLKKVTDQIMSKDFKSARKAYESVAGTYADEPNKKWIIDVDKPYDADYVESIRAGLKTLRPVIGLSTVSENLIYHN